MSRHQPLSNLSDNTGYGLAAGDSTDFTKAETLLSKDGLRNRTTSLHSSEFVDPSIEASAISLESSLRHQKAHPLNLDSPFLGHEKTELTSGVGVLAQENERDQLINNPKERTTSNAFALRRLVSEPGNDLRRAKSIQLTNAVQVFNDSVGGNDRISIVSR